MKKSYYLAIAYSLLSSSAALAAACASDISLQGDTSSASSSRSPFFISQWSQLSKKGGVVTNGIIKFYMPDEFTGKHDEVAEFLHNCMLDNKDRFGQNKQECLSHSYTECHNYPVAADTANTSLVSKLKQLADIEEKNGSVVCVSDVYDRKLFHEAVGVDRLCLSESQEKLVYTLAAARAIVHDDYKYARHYLFAACDPNMDLREWISVRRESAAGVLQKQVSSLLHLCMLVPHLIDCKDDEMVVVPGAMDKTIKTLLQIGANPLMHDVEGLTPGDLFQLRLNQFHSVADKPRKPLFPYVRAICKALAAPSTDESVQVIRQEWPIFMRDGKKDYFKHSIMSLDYSPDGSKLAFVTDTGAAYVRCAQTGALIHELKPSTIRAVKIPNDTREDFKYECGREIRFSPDGQRIAAGFDDGNVYIWDSISGELSNKLGDTARWALALAFNPKVSDQLAVGYTRENSVGIWDASLGKRVQTLQHTSVKKDSNIESVDYSADGAILASGSTDGTVHVWRSIAAMWQCAHRLDHGSNHVYAVRFDPHNPILASGMHGSGKIRLWDAVSGARLKTLHKKHGCAYRLAWSSDGKKIASGSTLKVEVELFDVVNDCGPDEIILHELPSGRSSVVAVFNPHDDVIAAAAGDSIQLLPLPVDSRSRAASDD